MCILTNPNILTFKEIVYQKLNLRRLLPCIENKNALNYVLRELPKYVVHFNVIVINIWSNSIITKMSTLYLNLKSFVSHLT